MKDEFLSNVNISFLNKIRSNLKKCKSFSFSVSFIKKAGLVLLEREIEEALDRGAKGRIITSTYQNFTDIGSLEQFYAWQKEYDNFECHLDYECFGDNGFHTKGYLFEYDDSIEFIVGSSNITRFALLKNFEWNVSLISKDNLDSYNDALIEFELIWDKTLELDTKLIEKYRSKDKIVSYMIDRYIYNGYCYHGFNSSFKESILAKGLNGDDTISTKLRNINNILEKYGIRNAMTYNWSYKDNNSIFTTDNFGAAYYYSLLSPVLLSRFVSNGLYSYKEGYDNLAFYIKNYEGVMNNISKMMSEYNINNEDRNIITSTVKDLLEELFQVLIKETNNDGNIDEVLCEILDLNPYVYCYFTNCGDIKAIDINENEALYAKYLVNKYSKMIVKIDRVFESFERIRAFEKLFVLNSLEYKILFYLAFKNEKCLLKCVYDKFTDRFETDEIAKSIDNLQKKKYLVFENDYVYVTKMFDCLLRVADETD